MAYHLQLIAGNLQQPINPSQVFDAVLILEGTILSYSSVVPASNLNVAGERNNMPCVANTVSD